MAHVGTPNASYTGIKTKTQQLVPHQFVPENGNIASIIHDTGASQILDDAASSRTDTEFPITRTMPSSPPVDATHLNRDEQDNTATGLTNPMSTAASNYTTDGTGRTC